MLSYVRGIPYVLFLVCTGLGATQFFVDLSGRGPEPAVVLGTLAAMMAIHGVLALGVRARDGALARLGRGVVRRAARGLQFLGVLALLGLSLGAVFLDPSGLLASAISVGAVGWLAWHTPQRHRRWLTVPGLFLAVGLLLPGDAGLFRLADDSPLARPYLLGFADQLKYLAVVSAIVVQKLDHPRFLRLFGGLTVGIVIAIYGFMAPSLESASLSTNPEMLARDPHTALVFAWMMGPLGAQGTLSAMLLVVAVAAAIPLGLRLAWRTVDNGSFSDTVVAKAIDANAVLITFVVAMMAMSYSISSGFTPVSFVSGLLLYLFAVDELPLAGFAASVLRTDEPAA